MKELQTIFDFQVVVSDAMPPDTMALVPSVEWKKCQHADHKRPADGLPFAVGQPCYTFCCAQCFQKHACCKGGDRCLVLDDSEAR